MGNDERFEGVTLSATGHRLRMNPRAVEIMREALEKISSIHQPTSDPAEKYDREEVLEKLDFAVITASNALDRAAMPGESQN
jgi:hypothetical protein